MPAAHQLCHQLSGWSWKSHALLYLLSSPVKQGGERSFKSRWVYKFQGSAPGAYPAPGECLPVTACDGGPFPRLLTSWSSGLHPQLRAQIQVPSGSCWGDHTLLSEGAEMRLSVTRGNVSSSLKEVPVINAKQHEGLLLSWWHQTVFSVDSSQWYYAACGKKRSIFVWDDGQ